MRATVSVQVPGKVMLSGEYSVLGGGRALAASLDRHLVVRVRPKQGLGGAMVASDLWDAPRFVSKDAQATGEPLLDAVAWGLNHSTVTDLEIRIDSELDIRFGFGSSSALRLGVLLALDEMARINQGTPLYRRPKKDLIPLARQAYILQKKAQSQASGYDVATQLLGGLVTFEMGASEEAWPAHAQPCDTSLQNNLPRLVHLFGGGAGAPTGQILPSTLTWLEQSGRLGDLASLNESLGQLFLKTLADPDNSACRRSLYQTAREHRLIFSQSPAYPGELFRLMEELPGCDETWSFKTTGAGGEDALLLLGSHSDLRSAESFLKGAGWYRLPVGFETHGARITRGEVTNA